MLKLKNIKITDAYIEADYIPECSSECGHIKMNRVTKEIDVRSVIGFSGTYTRIAINGLERILYDIKKDPSYTPNERLVMWY
mgnify:FL=1